MIGILRTLFGVYATGNSGDNRALESSYRGSFQFVHRRLERIILKFLIRGIKLNIFDLNKNKS